MKRLFIAVLVLLALCSCGKKENNDPSIKDDEPKQEVNNNEMRCFIYMGGEGIKNPEELIVPDVFYNGLSYDYNTFLKAFRFARYIKIDEEGKGVSVNVDFEENKAQDINGNSFSLPVFTVSEENCEVYFNDNAAKIGDKFYGCFIEDDILHLENEVFKEITSEELEGILNGTSGFKALADLEINDYMALGHIEQDNCIENGADPIYWRVIDKKDDTVLLISEYVIDSKRFNDDENGTNWNDSSLRNYLNTSFIDSVFTQEEKDLIVTSHLENRSYADYLGEYYLEDNNYIDYGSMQSVDNGPDSDDKVFVLDLDETIRYLGEEDGYYPSFLSSEEGPKKWMEIWNKYGIDLTYGASGRLSRPSDCIIRYSTVGFSDYHQSSTRHYALYWLRTMGDRQNRAIAVTDIGAFMPYETSSINVGVRPAMWIRYR